MFRFVVELWYIIICYLYDRVYIKEQFFDWSFVFIQGETIKLSF